MASKFILPCDSESVHFSPSWGHLQKNNNNDLLKVSDRQFFDLLQFDIYWFHPTHNLASKVIFHMDPPEWRCTPKCGTPKGNFPFGVRFSPFLASQHRGGLTWKNSKSYLKTQQGIYIAGNIILIQKSYSKHRIPYWVLEFFKLTLPVPRCKKRAKILLRKGNSLSE